MGSAEISLFGVVPVGIGLGRSAWIVQPGVGTKTERAEPATASVRKKRLNPSSVLSPSVDFAAMNTMRYRFLLLFSDPTEIWSQSVDAQDGAWVTMQRAGRYHAVFNSGYFVQQSLLCGV